jgi:hypothetical protein
MKRIFLLVALAITVLHASGQTKAEEIKSPIVSEQDADYYAVHTDLWRDIARSNPKDEQAWKNYFRAAWYKKWYNKADTTANDVLREMEKAVPGSYIYNYACYRKYMGMEESHLYARAAMKQLPETMDQNDYDIWFCYAAQVGDEENMERIAKRYYNSGLYSPYVLQYNYNELQGMEENGIYIGNGDAILIPKWIVQYAKGLHRDKAIVCMSFLALKHYREYIFRKLGVEMPEFKEAKTQADYDENVFRAVEALRKGTKRPTYFSSFNGVEINKPWEDKLYNEGLTLKYSDKPYDNFAVKRSNVEERYLLEYLIESFSPNKWDSGNRLNANYVVMLSDLLDYYKKNNQKRYKWLRKLLLSALNGSEIEEERKQKMMEFIK